SSHDERLELENGPNLRKRPRHCGLHLVPCASRTNGKASVHAYSPVCSVEWGMAPRRPRCSCVTTPTLQWRMDLRPFDGRNEGLAYWSGGRVPVGNRRDHLRL